MATKEPARTAVIETSRLVLRRLDAGDAAFIVELVNDPDWLRFIGDRGVRTPEDAVRYLAEGPLKMYERHGFGLWVVELKDGAVPIGLCGLIKRDSLPDVDLGFAFLPRFRGQGYGVESAAASLGYGVANYGLERVVAITNPDNTASARLLERLGFEWERTIALAGRQDDPVHLYAYAPQA